MPASWIFANDGLFKHALQLQPTDLSSLLSPQLSLVHYANVIDTYRTFPSAPPLPSVSRHLLSRILRRGYSTLGHFGSISISPDFYTPILHVSTPTNVRDAPPTSSLSRDWSAFLSWLTCTFRSITTLSPAGPDLLLPPTLRQEVAERLVLTLPSDPLHSTHHHLPAQVYASDASFIPPSLSTTLPTVDTSQPPSSLTLSVVGPSSGLVASLSSPRYQAATSHAEVAGCLSAVLHANHHAGGTIYSDYLPVVNWLSSVTRVAPSAFHRWLRDIYQRRQQATAVVHVKAHTNSLSLPARLNRAADHAASHCHSLYRPPPSFPTPTFFLPPYCIFTHDCGFIEGNFTRYIQARLNVAFNASHSAWSTHLTSPHLYDHTPPPPFPYRTSPYAYAATVQLYARSAQLDSGNLLASRLDAGYSPWCRFGCDALSSPLASISMHCVLLLPPT